MKQKRDILGAAALVAALVGTASAEYALALATGFNRGLAACVPAALDIYALRAFRAHRDVPAVVIALILVNAAAHLVSAGFLPVSTVLIVVVSSIAPLVMWRVHALGGAAPAPTAPEVASADAPACTQMHVSAEMPASAPEMPVDAPAPVPAIAPRVRTYKAQPDAPDPLIADARALDAAAGKPVGLREMQAALHIGQKRAQRIRAALA